MKIIFILAFLWSPLVLSDTYKLDVSHSTLGFKIRHLGFSWVRGNFKNFSGTGQYDPKKKKLTDLKVSIDASTIDTNEPDRDNHLRSKDFFETKKFPKLTFESTEIKYTDKIPSKILGKITIHGVTQELELDIKEWGGIAVDPWQNVRMAFEATGKIDRRKFGLTWNKGLTKVAGMMVGNDVFLILEIQAIKSDGK